jgi:hypothetical protein
VLNVVAGSPLSCVAASKSTPTRRPASKLLDLLSQPSSQESPSAAPLPRQRPLLPCLLPVAAAASPIVAA